MKVLFLNIAQPHKVSFTSKRNLPLGNKGSAFRLGNFEIDTFEKRNDNLDLIQTNISDMEDNPVCAAIKKQELSDSIARLYGDGTIRYTIYANEKEEGYFLASNNESNDALELKELYTKDPRQRKYKGLGSELIKTAIKVSKQRNMEGGLTLCATHTPSPYDFYYKNNFKIKRDKSYNYRLEGAIDYSSRYNLSIDDVLSDYTRLKFLNMFLDKEGADALLEGRQLYRERKSIQLSRETIEGKTYFSNLVESSKRGEYFICVFEDMPNSNDEKRVPKLRACAILEKTDKGYKTIYEDEASILPNNDICEYLKNSIEEAKKSLALL